MFSDRTGTPATGVPVADVYPGQMPLACGTIDRPLHLAIGMFDGVHLGHQRVITEAVRMGSVPGHLSGVLTFHPHPARILRPSAAPPLLISVEERVQSLLGLGLSHVFVHPFSEEFARLEAPAFIPYLQYLFPGLESIHVGENFRFGAGRKGNGTLLKEAAAESGLYAYVHPPLCIEGASVSSSRIRELLLAGKIKETAALLGRPYTIHGTIVPGRQIGRQLGFPTMNLNWHPEVYPPFGVYAVGCRMGDKSTVFPGVANLGVRPSFGRETTPVFEVHLLSKPLGGWPEPGDSLEVEFRSFIRREQAFPVVEELRKQIQTDIETAVKDLGWERGDA